MQCQIAARCTGRMAPAGGCGPSLEELQERKGEWLQNGCQSPLYLSVSYSR